MRVLRPPGGARFVTVAERGGYALSYGGDRWRATSYLVSPRSSFLFFGGLAPRKGFGLLVPLGYTRCRACTCGLSTSSSLTALVWRSYLEGGFVLRCFQHLSWPDAATRRCPWRNNRYTGGLSNTVLSPTLVREDRVGQTTGVPVVPPGAPPGSRVWPG